MDSRIEEDSDGEKQMNSILEIFPYRTAFGWSFDDAELKIKGEPFVSGIPAIIDRFAGKANRISIRFSASKFPCACGCLIFESTDSGGAWYSLSGTKMDGWLCPVLLMYFKTAPKAIYFEIVKGNP
jgi:hypothetical protein